MHKLMAAFFILILSVTSAASSEEKEDRHSCGICGMYIDQFHDTSTQLTLKNGEEFETCGVACMLRSINDKGGPDAFSSIEVHDWKDKVVTTAAEATYVIGSKIMPDMVPNIIAFRIRADAEAFKAKEGGEIINFTQVLMSISPMGMTMPTRIKTAVLSPQGSLAAGVGYMHMTMDTVKVGSNSVDPSGFVRRPGQITSPKKMTADSEMLMINYGLTDNLSVGLTAAYFQKRMESYKNSGAVTETTKNDGFGDLDLNFRYNLWKNAYYSKFFSLLAGMTLPTGEFKKELITMPGMQIGTEAFSFTGGLLFSHRYKDFWFHYLASYTTMLENSDDYKFGDTTRFGAAVHYTPNYDIMLGLEIDGSYMAKDRYLDQNMNSTGGFKSNLTGVAEWKFMTAMGGTFSVRGSGGVPIYEDLNHYAVVTSEKVKLGGGCFVSGSMNYSRRFPVF
jgi:nitrous oxide reductase accessory protein NosL